MDEVAILEDHPEVLRLRALAAEAGVRIDVRPVAARIRYFHGSTRIFDTDSGLLLFERGYSPVVYVPKTDILENLLRPSRTRTHCPFKGDAHYWSVNISTNAGVDMAWEYAQPLPGVAGIRGHVAFAGDRPGGRYLIDNVGCLQESYV